MQQLTHVVALLLTATACLATAASCWVRPRTTLLRPALSAVLVSAGFWCLVAAPGHVPGDVDPPIARALLAGACATASSTWFLVRLATDATWKPPPVFAWAGWIAPPLLLLVTPLGGAAWALETGLIVQGDGQHAETSVSWSRVVLTAAAVLVLFRVVLARRRLPRFTRRPLTTLILMSTLVCVATAATVTGPAPLLGADYAPLAWGLGALVTADVLLRAGLAGLVPPTTRQVLDAVPDAVLVVDVTGRLVGVNGAGRRLALPAARAGSTTQLLGRPAVDVLPPALWPTGDRGQRSPHFFEVDGVQLEARSNAVRDPRGELVAEVIVCREVTAFVARQARAEAAYRAVEQERSRFETLTSQLVQELSSAERAKTQLAEDVIRDPLTGLHNRRRLEPAIEAAVTDARTRRERAAVFIVDIDHFKRVNDTHGHDVGDRVLRALGDALGSCRSEGETVVRYGGEEFVVVVPAIGPFDAVRRADEIRRRLGEIHIPLRAGDDGLRVTVSIGVSSFPDNGDSATELLASADVALYAAKAAGRNCVVAA
ncbi:MAG: diguanylate cyclase with sensor [Actinotalea sp.]|nr:diguanylate cyclase with sensor [Actinotalea sp.]